MRRGWWGWGVLGLGIRDVWVGEGRGGELDGVGSGRVLKVYSLDLGCTYS